MTSTYWKANKAKSAEIKQIYTDLKAYTDERCNLSRRLGFSATKVAIATGWFGDQTVVGFYLKRNWTNPDPKLYKKSKATDERGIHCWIPKRVKVNNDHNALLDERFPKLDRLGTALEIENVINVTSYSPGIHIRPNGVYIELEECQGKPVGCRQITDITFRKARDAKQPKKK
jgi:hypothetical protein